MFRVTTCHGLPFIRWSTSQLFPVFVHYASGCNEHCGQVSVCSLGQMPRSVTAGLYRGCTFSLFKETTTLFLGWVVTVLREGEGEGESDKMPFKKYLYNSFKFLTWGFGVVGSGSKPDLIVSSVGHRRLAGSSSGHSHKACRRGPRFPAVHPHSNTSF